MLNENDITNLLVNYFESCGYKNVIGLTTTQKGIDVTAIDNEGQRVCIEVKGETSSKIGTNRYGSPFDGNQIASHVSVALMKTIVTMNQEEFKDAKFGMAFPMNHEILIRKILPSLKKLDITVYLVSTEKVVII